MYKTAQKTPTTKYITMKLENTKDTFKSNQKGKTGATIRPKAVVSNQQERPEENLIISSKCWEFWISYSAKLQFKSEGKIKVFSD